MAFDLDKNKFVGAAEIRHVLINIGEQVYRSVRTPVCGPMTCCVGTGPSSPIRVYQASSIWNRQHAMISRTRGYITQCRVSHTVEGNVGIQSKHPPHLLFSQVTDDEVDEMIRMVDKDGDGQVGHAMPRRERGQLVADRRGIALCRPF